MDLFEYNFNYLKDNYPLIYEKVECVDLDFSAFTIEEFQSSLLNLVHFGESGERNCLYEKIEFDNQIISINEDSKKYRFCIGMGLGLGYLYLPLIKEKFVKDIIIIEPDIRILLIYLHLYRIEELLENEKVTLILGGNKEDWIKEVDTKHKHFFDHEIKFIITNYYKKNFRDDFFGFITDFEKRYISSISNRYTIDIFINKYLKNSLRNIYYQVPKSSRLDCLYDKYQNIPAVIVGAGPSLNKQIEQLRQLQGKAIIFAVGSAINVLEHHQITPTFRVGIDTSEMEAKYFNKLNDKSVDLIYFSILNEKSFDGYTGNLYYSTSYSTSDIVSFLEEKLTLNVQPVLGGGSVSVFTVDMASRMGCSPIILIGQDFAFDDLNLYAKGAVGEKRMDIESDRLIKKKDIYGNDTYTRQNMYSLKLSFDSYIKQSCNKRVINCTEGGLGIENVSNEKFVDIIEKYCKENLKINKIFDLYNNKNEVIELYKSIIKQTSELEIIFEKLITIINKMQALTNNEKSNSILCILNEELKEEQMLISDIEFYGEYLLPICEYKLEAIDIEYQKEDYLQDTEYDKQKMFIKYMKKQYEVLQQMNKFISDTVKEIIYGD